MLIETCLLWAISIFIQWDFMEFFFLGGVLVFTILWLFLYFNNHNQNIYNARMKGMTGEVTERVKLFRFRLSPITIGLVLYMVLSFCLTIYYYYDYFILLSL